MAVRDADALKRQVAGLLADNDAGDISEADVRSVFTDIIESVPSLGLTAEQARDLVGGMLDVLGPFAYSARTNILTLDLSAYEPVVARYWFGLSDDARPNGAEGTIRSATGAANLPAFNAKHVVIFRIDSDPDITHVEFSDAPGVNRIADFSRYERRPGQTTTVSVAAGISYKAWASTNVMTKANPVTVTAR